MISYSVTKSLAIICILFTVGSVDYLTILESQINNGLYLALLPVTIILIITCVAELGRPPFDLLEAESEQVAGHMTEYSSISFAFFFLAEYSMMLFMGVFISVLLFGQSTPVPFLFFLFLIRASFPRVRIDNILYFNWGHLLPFLTGYIILLYPQLLILS